MPEFTTNDFETIYQNTAETGLAWVIDRPQPFLTQLHEAGQITGSVLDIGCGTGDNAIFLATKGLAVTGIDGATTAIATAQARAAQAGVQVRFEVGDAVRLDGYTEAFDTIIDSALFHCVSPETHADYIAAAHRAAKPGARLHLTTWSDTLPSALPDDFRISKEYLGDTVGTKWTVDRIELTQYVISLNRGQYAQSINAVFGTSLTETCLADLHQDVHGNVLLPMWQLAATRIG